MPGDRRCSGRLLAPVLLTLSLGAQAVAQDWPSRPLTLVVPFPAGGPIDVMARILAPPMGELLGQQIIIENVSGAGGMTGSARVAKAAPDGYQFLLGNSGTHTYSQLLYKKPLYSAVADFTPVAVFVENSKVLVARNDFPADTLPAFIAYARANAPKMQYGSAGAGSATHMTCVLLNAAIGIDITHVPYRGTGPAHAGPDGRTHRLHLRRDLDLAAARTQPLGQGDRAAVAATQLRAARSRPPRRNRASRDLTPTPGTRSSSPGARRMRSFAASQRR